MASTKPFLLNSLHKKMIFLTILRHCLLLQLGVTISSEFHYLVNNEHSIKLSRYNNVFVAITYQYGVQELEGI